MKTEMEMIRTIRPVGQGAFYTEQFFVGREKYNMVYDCGSGMTKTSGRIRSAIADGLRGEKEITAIFISHFHNDHINGIEELLTRFDVKYVFFPELTKESHLLMKLYGGCNQKFADDSPGYIHSINPDTRAVQVNIAGQESPWEMTLLSPPDNFPDSVPSGTSLIITGEKGETIWRYVPYNIENKHLEQQLRNAYDKTITVLKKYSRIIPEPFPSEIDFDWLKRQAERVRKITDWEPIKMFKEVYNDRSTLGADKNANSMVLYSGAENPAKWIGKGKFRQEQGIGSLSGRTTGCLYLGDYDLNHNGLANIIKKYNGLFSTVSMVQVPHHGSKGSFDKGLCDCPRTDCLYFISYGKDNKYGHPSKGVTEYIENFLKRNPCSALCRVTEEKLSEIKIIYSMR